MNVDAPNLVPADDPAQPDYLGGAVLSGLARPMHGALSWSFLRTLVLGHSSRVCAFLVTLTALPTLAATFWALRQLAPTRLTLSGALAGLFAGAAGAFVYSFHCTEGAAPFIAIWYTLGIVLTTALGALLGPRLLRW